MKIKNIIINKNKNIKNLSISFKDGELTVICGENGTGKTTILESIILFFHQILTSDYNIKQIEEKIDAVIDLNDWEKKWFMEIKKVLSDDFYNVESLTYETVFSKLEKNHLFKSFNKSEIEVLPKLIYLPAEIIFDIKDSKIDNLLNKKYTLLTIINSNFAKQIESFIVSKYFHLILQNGNIVPLETKKTNVEVC